MPLSTKVDYINAIYTPSKVHGIIWFVQIIKYYRKMCHKWTHILAPITKSCSTRFKFKRTDVKQSDFMETKKIVGRDVLFSYPGYIEDFIIHTDANRMHIGVLMIQNENPLAFYSIFVLKFFCDKL